MKIKYGIRNTPVYSNKMLVIIENKVPNDAKKTGNNDNVNVNHNSERYWHWTTCLVKSLIHDACMIFVWAEELSRHTVVLCVCLSCSCLNMIFCLFRVPIFQSETLMQSFTVCVMIGVSTDIFLFFYLCTFYFFLFFSFLFVYDFHNNNNNNNISLKVFVTLQPRGLASYWPCVTDISGSPPTGSRPRKGR